MPVINWETVRDMFRFWFHEPESFMKAYDKGVIQHTPEVEITHEMIIEFGDNRKVGANIWEDKKNYR